MHFLDLISSFSRLLYKGENGDISSELVDERDQVATAGVRGRERTNHIGMNYVTGAVSSGNRASQ
jgi:hypothetical protein